MTLYKSFSTILYWYLIQKNHYTDYFSNKINKWRLLFANFKPSCRTESILEFQPFPASTHDPISWKHLLWLSTVAICPGIIEHLSISGVDRRCVEATSNLASSRFAFQAFKDHHLNKKSSSVHDTERMYLWGIL